MYGFGSRKKGIIPVTSICDPFLGCWGRCFLGVILNVRGLGNVFKCWGVLVVNAIEEKFKFVRGLGPILDFRVN